MWRRWRVKELQPAQHHQNALSAVLSMAQFLVLAKQVVFQVLNGLIAMVV